MEQEKEKYRALAQGYLATWRCTPEDDPFHTHSSILWPVSRDGAALMLKIPNPDDDEAHAAGVLEYFGGRGAVRLVERDGQVQLLERIVPDDEAPTLERMTLDGRDDDATRIICGVIAELHAPDNPRPPPQNLIPFRSRSDAMRGHVEEGRVKPEDRPAFQTAYDLCDGLIEETRDTVRPLHGDIHHFNILHSPARGWLAIDPKGILGPRVYEYANMLCNPYMHGDIVANEKRMERQAALIAELAGLDEKLLLQFTFLHAMQCAAWSLHEPDQGYWLACGKTAAGLSGITL